MIESKDEAFHIVQDIGRIVDLISGLKVIKSDITTVNRSFVAQALGGIYR